MEDEYGCEIPEPQYWTVCITFVERCYGGSEEGGWWYDSSEPSNDHMVETFKMFVREDDANKYAAHLRATMITKLNEGRRPLHSVLSDGAYGAEVYHGMPRHLPERRPHYE